ncbi:MAG: AAA family ATPase [Bacteroidia bacterium]
MRKLPYGISNFAEIPKRDYFFADKTPFLHKLEDLGEKYIFLLRPRRFGKSLWISILQHYYGTQYKEKFQDLFGKYYVGKNPTENANNYLILCFDFSGIDTSTAESTYQGFLRKVLSGTHTFMVDYPNFFTKTQHKNILQQTTPEGTISSLFDALNEAKNALPVYLLIDEYDHFANELLALNLKHFRAIVGRNGWVRKFYETIKTATRDGLVERMFVTGVSPATLDSMTSGFNIASSLTRDPNFHEMFGFNESEVVDLLENVGVTQEKMPYTLEQMRAWYDGFKMNAKAKNHIYNPDMVLFFGKEYLSAGEFPDKMLDDNIATDYGKIRGIFQIENQEQKRVQVLKDLLEKGFVRTEIVSRFNFEMEFGQAEFISLLFYMGLLSIENQEFGRTQLKIPNYVIKALYFQYFYQLLRESELTPVSLDEVSEVVYQLAKYGDTDPLKELINNILAEHSLRDKANFSEKHLKTIFITLFYISNIYIVDSEPETKQKFMDILLLGRKDFKVPFNYLFELKYAKKPKKEEKNAAENADNEEFDEKVWLTKLREETITQLNTYRNTEKVRNIENLRSYILIVADMKIAFFEEIS